MCIKHSPREVGLSHGILGSGRLCRLPVRRGPCLAVAYRIVAAAAAAVAFRASLWDLR